MWIRKTPLLLIILISLLTQCDFGEKKTPLPKLPAKFITPYNNTAIQKGKELNITIAIQDPSAIEQLTLNTKDTIIYEGNVTSDELNFVINTAQWKVGATPLFLTTTLTDGSIKKDNRLVRILSNVYPTDYKAKVIEAFPHKTNSYTQGLEFDNGTLYEGTGGMGMTGGQSFLAQVNYKTGEHIKAITLAPEYFGEGITIFNDLVYQLTWQQNKCFVYDKNNLEKVNEYTYSGEGWGLCNDGEHLIQSDGTERLYFRDPSTFTIQKTIEVYSNDGPVRFLNELEFINGRIYANVYQSNNIVIIHPETGIVEGIIDASMVTLEHRGNGEVLNGIAYQKSTNRIFITGKNWPKLLVVELVEL